MESDVKNNVFAPTEWLWGGHQYLLVCGSLNRLIGLDADHPTSAWWMIYATLDHVLLILAATTAMVWLIVASILGILSHTINTAIIQFTDNVPFAQIGNSLGNSWPTFPYPLDRIQLQDSCLNCLVGSGHNLPTVSPCTRILKVGAIVSYTLIIASADLTGTTQEILSIGLNFGICRGGIYRLGFRGGLNSLDVLRILDWFIEVRDWKVPARRATEKYVLVAASI